MTFKYVKTLIMAIAVFAVISYFLHIIFGTLAYPGYDWLSQPVSDLTAEGAPSMSVARRYSNLYGILTSMVSIFILIQQKKIKNHKLRLGSIFISMMYLLSAIGYALFPLDEVGSQMSFQNIMHIVVTIGVVFLTIVALMILMLAFKELKLYSWFIITLTAFLLMMSGAMLTNLASVAYLGLFERFSVFSAVIYHLVIPYLQQKYPNL